MTSTVRAMRSSSSLSGLDYDVDRSYRYISGRRISIGLRSRSQERAGPQTPGPGAYEVGRRRMTHGLITTSHTPVDERLRRPNAGPASYSREQEPFAGRRIRPSIKGSGDGGTTEHDGPGPAAYNVARINDEVKAGPRFSMAFRARAEQVGQSLPAGANYTPRTGFTRRAVPGFTFGREAARPDRGNGVPGPGTYNVAGRLGGGGFTFRSRTLSDTF